MEKTLKHLAEMRKTIVLNPVVAEKKYTVEAARALEAAINTGSALADPSGYLTQATRYLCERDYDATLEFYKVMGIPDIVLLGGTAAIVKYCGIDPELVCLRFRPRLSRVIVEIRQKNNQTGSNPAQKPRRPRSRKRTEARGRQEFREKTVETPAQGSLLSPGILAVTDTRIRMEEAPAIVVPYVGGSWADE